MQVDYKGSVSPGKAHIGIRVIPGKEPGGEVMLRPGANTITDEKWSEIEGHKAVVNMLEQGELRILKGTDKGGFDISKLSPLEASDLITRTTEVPTLERWKKQLEAASAGGKAAVWKNPIEQLVKQLDACTTDVDGKPAAQRPLQMLPA